MKKLLSFLLFTTSLIFTNSIIFGQVNIIPVRTDVSGFATWTDTDVTGTTYVQLLQATSTMVTPAMDFTAFTGESLNFKARTFGGVNATENTITVSISVNNGGSWTILGTRTPVNTTLTAQTAFDLSSYNGTQVKVKFSVAGTLVGVGSGLDDISITGFPPSSPTITVNPTTLSGMNYVFGNGPSAEQSFVASGINLTNNILLTAPANYQISTTSGSGFTNSITLTQAAGTVSNTTVYVRLISGLIVGTYNGGTISATSTGATAQSVTCNGIVTNPTDPAVPTTLFEIQNILVDACAGSVEGQNEMVIFQVGPTNINVTDIRVDGAGTTGVVTTGNWPNTTNNWLGISPPPANPADIAYVNSTITNCGYLIEPVGGILLAGKKILMITSTAWDPTAHSFASLQDTLYVIFQNAGNTAGHFVNYGTASERTFVLTHVPSGYADTIIYDRSLLETQAGTLGAEDGGAVAYTWSGIPDYYNNGCQAPYIPMNPSWNFSSPTICETDASINLSSLVTGTPGGTWSGTGVSGTNFSPASLSGNIDVTYTIGTAPCTASEMHSITVNTNTTPTFTALGPYCVGDTPAALLGTSTNSIAGTWSPPTISTASAGTTVYNFTPTAGQCALTTTMSITISSASITPSFTALGPYCVGESPSALPGSSTNGISGTWSPTIISTASAGTTVYTFTPSVGQCATTTTMSISVISGSIVPSFSALGPYCALAVAAVLPGTSNNGITGTWSPATISTASAGTTVYTFTPTAGQCATTTTMSILVNANTTPTFTALGPYCVGASVAALPGTSTNGITGTWSPSTISTATTGTTIYTFTPTAGQCATTTTMSVTVNANITPSFTTLGPYCVGASVAALPGTSTNGITGTWSPATISTATTGNTVYTFTPTAAQCATTTTMSVAVNANITPIFTALGPYCVGAVPASLSGTSTNGITGSWSPATISTAAAGTTVYTFTPTAGQCATTRTMSITVNANITPTFTVLGPYCVGAVAAALPGTSTNGISGTWSPATISTVSAGTIVYTFTPTAGQCATTRTMSITVNANITPTFTALGPYCLGSVPAALPATSINGISGTWSPATISTASAATTIYTFTPTAGQCATTATMSVLVDVSFTPTFIQLGPYCEGEIAGALNTTSTNGITGSWSPSAINTTNATTTVHTFTPDAGQCAVNTSMSVIINSNPVISLTSTDPNCFGNIDGVIDINISGGNPGFDLYWNGGSTVISGNSYQISGLADGNYIISVSDINNCQDTETTILTEPVQLTISATNTAITINGGTSTVTVVATGGTPPYSGTGSFTVNAGTFTYTVTDANGCSVSQTITITEPLALLAISTATAIECYGELSTVTVTASGGIAPYSGTGTFTVSAGTYSYTVTDAAGATDITTISISEPSEIIVSEYLSNPLCNGQPGVANIIVTSGGTAPFSIMWQDNTTNFTNVNVPAAINFGYTITDNNSCNLTGSVLLNQPMPLDFTYTVNNLGCYGATDGSILLTSISGGTEPYNFEWSNGSISPDLTNVTAGNYHLTVTDASSCSKYDSFVLTNPTPISISANITNIKCFGSNDGSITITATGGYAPYLVSWNNSQSIMFLSNLQPGVYTVTVSDNNACSSSATYTINQPSQLELTTETQNNSCFGANDGFIKMIANGGTIPYVYSIYNGEATDYRQYNMAALPGSYSLKVEDANGCFEEQFVTISEPGEITANYNYGNPSCEGNNDGFVEFVVYGGSEPYTYYWNESMIEIPLISALIQGEYLLSVSDANNCVIKLGIATLIDNPIDCITIPNAFTPNADGVNDTWIVENIEIFEGAYLQVFNRWGQIIWEAKATEDPWDGTFNNKFVPTGTYLYVIDLHNGTEAYVGIVTVVY